MTVPSIDTAQRHRHKVDAAQFRQLLQQSCAQKTRISAVEISAFVPQQEQKNTSFYFFTPKQKRRGSGLHTPNLFLFFTASHNFFFLHSSTHRAKNWEKYWKKVPFTASPTMRMCALLILMELFCHPQKKNIISPSSSPVVFREMKACAVLSQQNNPGDFPYYHNMDINVDAEMMMMILRVDALAARRAKNDKERERDCVEVVQEFFNFMQLKSSLCSLALSRRDLREHIFTSSFCSRSLLLSAGRKHARCELKCLRERFFNSSINFDTLLFSRWRSRDFARSKKALCRACATFQHGIIGDGPKQVVNLPLIDDLSAEKSWFLGIFDSLSVLSESLRVMRFPAGGLCMLSCFHSAQCSKFTSLLSTFRSQWHFSETTKKEKQKRDFRCENPAHIRDDSDEYSRKYEELNEHCRHGFSTPLKSGREFSHWISDPNVSLQD